MQTSVQVGITTDGKRVVSGAWVFKLVATHGLPLDVILDRVFPDGTAITWHEFCAAAINGGWSPKRILAYVDEALIDWPEHRAGIMPRLKALFEVKER